MRRVLCHPSVCLLLVITALLCTDRTPAQAQPPWPFWGTPHLIFSTYLGGSTSFDPSTSPYTFAQNTASDPEGNTYVTGTSSVSDLPVLNAWQQKPAKDSTTSAFVAKYDRFGTVLWCTYLGGNEQSVGVGAAVMPDGGVAVAGLTTSDHKGPFPTLHAFQEKNNGESDYFVAVFDASGNLRYSTYLGGSDVEGVPESVFADDSNNGNNIAVDARGLVYVTGITKSDGKGSGAIKFPVTPQAIQPDLAGDKDAFLAILDPSKSGQDSLVYSSFLGGSGDDKGHGIAVNASGSLVTVVGFTSSSDFPTTPNAYRSYPAPSGYISNGFVSQFSRMPGGPFLRYSPFLRYTTRYATYLGADTSDARDDTYGVALDLRGLIVATGRTQSADFPMNPHAPSIYNSAPYLKPGESHDQPYLVKINPFLSGKASLVYATFLGGGAANGGSGGSFCTSVAVDWEGRAYVGGETSAQGTEYTPSPTPVEAPMLFPYTEDALLPALQGVVDAMLMQITPYGATLGYSTFLGGKDSDRTYGLSVDAAGNVVQTGLTFSSDFPLKNPAQTWPGNEGQNAFVTKFSFHPWW